MKIIFNKDIKTRIDKFLAEEFFSHTRGEIIRNIKSGKILVNEKKVKPSYILKKDDEISSQLTVHSSRLIANKNIKLNIIYKDKNIIAINKPAGISVHPVSFKDKDTLVNGLLAKFLEIKSTNDGSLGSELRPGIVHRLDKDTSGVMVIARNQKAFDELKNLFKNHKVSKKYVALVYGQLPAKKGIIEKPMARAASYKKQVIAGRKTKNKIREAVTEYKVLKEFENYSLVEASPKTGRMHQIRVHLKSLGNPVVGDKIYRNKKQDNSIKVSRQMLHAQELEFKLFGKKCFFEVPVPEDLKKILHSLTPLEI
ncbi:MAG: RluA family pseudouridine synthase [Candidatus Moranbacteria bacterium]|nr:RluA family pseudouridine synthase [Candidatus Moranbacteria bacterium]